MQAAQPPCTRRSPRSRTWPNIAGHWSPERDALGSPGRGAHRSAVRRNRVHEIALRVESMRSSGDSLRAGMGRMQQQLAQTPGRCSGLEAQLDAGKAPIRRAAAAPGAATAGAC